MSQVEGPRLQRFLAEAGIAARRKAEVLITEGRVRVNGKVAELGSRVQPHDRVEVDGKAVITEKKRYLLLNKPRGCVSTLSDPEGRPTVMELLPKDGPRIYPVGRLDFNTEGLLLFTNDGDLANGLMHPRRAVPKTYHAKLRSLLTEGDVAALEAGIELDGAVRKAVVAGGGTSENGKHSWVELMITEGRNRQVHRMMESLGHEITRLIRVGYGPLVEGDLGRAKWRPLEPFELGKLRELAGVVGPRHELIERAPTPVKRTGVRSGVARGSRPMERGSARPSSRPTDRPRQQDERPSYGLNRKSKPPSGRKPSDRAPSGRQPPERTPSRPSNRPPGRPLATDRKSPHAHGDKKPARRR